MLDGWRFSDRPESDWFLREVELRNPAQRDPITGEYRRLSASPAAQQRAQQYRETIRGERYYRMRHVGKMELNTDATLMGQPSLSGLNACVAPGDVIVRRVGHISAAPVSSFHRRHPVDANIAVVRGLSRRKAIWVAYCLNQPIYRSYFEQPGAINSLVRLGLKQLASMPIAPPPAAFDTLADQYWQHYERLSQADDRLQQLRDATKRWIATRVPNQPFATPTDGLVAQRFEAKDIDSVLSHAATEQNRICRELIEEYQCVPLSRLAEVNPKGSASADQASTIIKIGDITGHFDIQLDAEASKDRRWRYHRRSLSPFAVLVSTFVQEPKVGLLSSALPSATFASEQLAVLNFHRTPGAYALLLETTLVRQQVARLATGTVQRFVQPEQFKRIVVPPIEGAIAQDWHQRLTEIQQQKSEARRELVNLDREMQQVFRRVHPELSARHQDDSPQEDNR
ncbi:restriction endonuclease subunit S [Parahaliea mediterranea]|uniref:restriction endonuclease subunit S n=1 Tax=Parahaliea mediterranea TaxID=651086 RepID=UPI001300534A|nr:hypothetical protein [Parahaliea mediterranea]